MMDGWRRRRVGGWVGEWETDLHVNAALEEGVDVLGEAQVGEEVGKGKGLGEVGGWVGGWVGLGWVEEDEAVRMSCCELGVRVGGWVDGGGVNEVGGWVGGWVGEGTYLAKAALMVEEGSALGRRRRRRRRRVRVEG